MAASEGSSKVSANPLRYLREVKNREVLEEQYDKYFQSRQLKLPTRFDSAQRVQLRRFFQVMDADNGGTISLDELEGPLLSTGMVTNHRELQALMTRIAAGGDEITFWQFLEAFKPKKPGEVLKEGEPDMKRLRFLLATAEHESLPEAFHRDHAEDGLSDAEEPVISLYASRAEALVRERQGASGGGGNKYWYERLHAGRGEGGQAAAAAAAGGGGGGAAGAMTELEVEAARQAAERAAAAAAMRKDSHLTLNTRIGLHRRRFLMSSIMQEKGRYMSKRGDLLTALRAAEVRHDVEEAGKLKEALKMVEARHGRRTERLEATRIVVANERSGYAGEEEEGEGDGGDEKEEGGEGEGGEKEGEEEEEEEEEEEDELMPWEDPVKLAAHTADIEAKLPRFQALLINLQRTIAMNEGAAKMTAGGGGK